MSSRQLFLCPHCKTKMRLTSSHLEAELFRVSYFQCTNVFCGFTARGEYAITHQVSPSSTPDPSVNLETFRKTG
ncbi:ogr/Delta-like zinc finger family protein [Acinetobacter pollinis]|nr:ogr/Delta-like zinc finger family protein [Acinetobacter pollinis]MBF7690846.1 ogr/Delta-like zinc finger family protein [Acinetobacter pollinis]MBF7698491.1 ogr/Delta-like zinc finger family protein [Acinetobacter pollinis]